jgi:hypothetical protein
VGFLLLLLLYPISLHIHRSNPSNASSCHFQNAPLMAAPIPPTKPPPPPPPPQPTAVRSDACSSSTYIHIYVRSGLRSATATKGLGIGAACSAPRWCGRCEHRVSWSRCGRTELGADVVLQLAENREAGFFFSFRIDAVLCFQVLFAVSSATVCTPALYHFSSLLSVSLGK